jgi:hypothetical protein
MKNDPTKNFEELIERSRQRMNEELLKQGGLPRDMVERPPEYQLRKQAPVVKKTGQEEIETAAHTGPKVVSDFRDGLGSPTLGGGDPKVSVPYNVQGHNYQPTLDPNQANAAQRYQFRKVAVAGRDLREVAAGLPNAPQEGAPEIQNDAPSFQQEPVQEAKAANVQSKIQQAIAKIKQSGVPTTANPERDQASKLAKENGVNVREAARNGWPPGTGRGGR